MLNASRMMIIKLKFIYKTSLTAHRHYAYLCMTKFVFFHRRFISSHVTTETDKTINSHIDYDLLFTIYTAAPNKTFFIYDIWLALLLTALRKAVV